METHKWNAEDYSQNSQIQLNLARELIAKLSLNGFEDVLDLGCGDGKVTAEIAKLVGHGSVIGVDSSASMIELATKHFPKEKNFNLSFEVMDARRLTFENRYDVVFSNAAMHWVKDHKPVVDALFKCLRQGGKILLQMGAKGGIDGFLSVVDEVISLPEWTPDFQGFEFPFGFMGVHDYQAMLSQSGFSAKRVEYLPKDVIHASQEKFKGWIRTTWVPYLERVPSEKKEQFIELIATKYIERFPLDDEGNVHVEMGMLEVEAEKLHR